MRIPRQLGEWLPDVPATANTGLAEAKGVYPSAGGYAPFYSAETTSLSVTGTVTGAARFYRSDMTEVIVVGTTSDLFVIVGGAVNASSLSLSLNANDNWQFERFGDAVYAVNPQTTTVVLSNINSGTTFAAPSNSIPTAATIAQVDDFLLIGRTDDGSDHPFRVQWSPYNNPTGVWSTDIALQSGYWDLPTRHGLVTAVAGGEVGMIFQERGVTRFDYVGGRTAFQAVEISDQVGCESAASVVRVGGRWFWLSNAGIATSDGASVDVISGGKVWDWFLETANTEKLSKVQAAINWDRRCIVWNFYQVDTTTYNAQLIYNWEEDRFAYALESIDWLVPVTYDGSFAEGDPRLRRILGGFISGTHYELSGTPIAARFETGELQLSPGQRTFLSEVWPIIDGDAGAATVQVGTRDAPSGSVTYSASAAMSAMGYAPVSIDGRYTRVRLDVAAGVGWEKATSLDIEAVQAGLA